MFYNREEEIENLEREFNSDNFSFIVLYGRRRVGKTELIKEFCRDRPHIYHLVSQDSEKLQRQKIIEDISNYFKERTPTIENWREAINYIGEKLATEDIIFAIDEFPYLIMSNESIVSYLQSKIDEELKNSNSMLILCGSSISIMESEVMGHKSPLYGRRTSQIDLKPFSFEDSLKIIDYDIKPSIQSYATLGGTPMYLQLFNYEKPLYTNILDIHMSKTSILYNEPEFLLRTELRNPSRYMSILEAIANGYKTPNEISGQTDIDTGPLSTYLQKLRRIRLIERIIPITAEKKKSKRSHYKIKDNFFSFWFRFIEPNISAIEQSPKIVIEDHIKPDFNVFVSKIFEDVCTEALWKMNKEELLKNRYSKIGPWWYKDTEIDILGLNPKNKDIVFCECKWKKTKVDTNLFYSLKEKKKEVRLYNDERTEEYVLFSKSGFTENLKEKTDENWTLIDLKKLENIFSS